MAELMNIPGLASRTDNAFRWALLVGSERFGFNPNYIAAVMRLESNFDPNIQNLQGAPALGLIQFWKSFFPPVAAKAGFPNTTWEDLRHMSAVEQLPFVFASFKGKGLNASSSPTDYYMANFMPAFVGKPDSFVLGEKDSDEFVPGTQLRKSKVYDQNFGLDSDGDGVITVGDVGAKITSIVNAARGKPPIEVVPEGDPLIVGPGGGSTDPLDPEPGSGSDSPSSGSGGSSSGEHSKPLSGAAKLPTLRVGSKGEAVDLWQRLFNAIAGMYNGSLRDVWHREMVLAGLGVRDDSALKDDGEFGPVTKAATVAIQKLRGLTPDGVVGPITWRHVL